MRFIVGGLGNWFNDYTAVKDLILEADKLGFYGALMPDHYMWGDRGGRMSRPDNFRTVDTWVTLSYLAGKTDQIKLGTLVTPVPFRPPSMMAKMVSTLDNISDGRVIFGVGAGWSREEFDGYAEWASDKIRVDQTKEGLELMLKLWKEDEVTFSGDFYKATKAVVDPKPVQKPHPPLLFGGSGNRMLSMAGRYGDIIFIPPWGDPSQLQEKRERVVKSAIKYNREDKIHFMTGTMMGPQVSTLDDFQKNVENAVNAGNDYFMPTFGRGEEALKLMGSFAKDIMPSYQ